MEMKGIRDSLIGTWQLVSYQAQSADNTITYPLGSNLLGFLFYTEDGFMSVHVMSPHRPTYASGDLQRGSTEEMAAAAQGYLAYTGPFSVDEAAGTVTHHIKLSLSPTWVSIDQTRLVRIEGDLLQLSAGPILVNGVLQSPLTIWKKM